MAHEPFTLSQLSQWHWELQSCPNIAFSHSTTILPSVNDTWYLNLRNVFAGIYKRFNHYTIIDSVFVKKITNEPSLQLLKRQPASQSSTSHFPVTWLQIALFAQWQVWLQCLPNIRGLHVWLQESNCHPGSHSVVLHFPEMGSQRVLFIQLHVLLQLAPKFGNVHSATTICFCFQSKWHCSNFQLSSDLLILLLDLLNERESDSNVK